MSRAEDPQLHTHVVTANMARGADGRWTALDATPIYQHARAAGFLYQAHLRAAVRERLPWVRWATVRNGMAEIEQVPPDVLREFSTRRRQIEERERELVEAGVEVGRAGREAIAHDTRERKRYGIDTAPWQEVVRARAAEHGLGARELRTTTRGPELPHVEPDVHALGAERAGAGGLTEKHNTFARRDAVMAWAAAHGQGASAAAVERAAHQFLTRPDVHGAPDPSARRFTTSDLLAHEEAIVRGAQARRDEGVGRLDRDIVDAAIACAASTATAEQAAAIRGMTSSGHGVETRRWPARARPSRRGCAHGPTKVAAIAWFRHSGIVLTRVNPSVRAECAFAQRASASLGPTRTLGARPKRARPAPALGTLASEGTAAVRQMPTSCCGVMQLVRRGHPAPTSSVSRLQAVDGTSAPRSGRRTRSHRRIHGALPDHRCPLGVWQISSLAAPAISSVDAVRA
jgi:hypothetical protein